MEHQVCGTSVSWKFELFLSFFGETLAVEHQSVGNECFFETGKKRELLGFFLFWRAQKKEYMKILNLILSKFSFDSPSPLGSSLGFLYNWGSLGGCPLLLPKHG